MSPHSPRLLHVGRNRPADGGLHHVFDRQLPLFERLEAFGKAFGPRLHAGWELAAKNLMELDLAPLLRARFPESQSAARITEVEAWLSRELPQQLASNLNTAQSDAARALLIEFESRCYRAGVDLVPEARELEYRLLLADLFDPLEWTDELPSNSLQAKLFSSWVSGLILIDLPNPVDHRVLSLHEYLEGTEPSPGSGTVVMAGSSFIEMRTFGYPQLDSTEEVDPERTLFDLGSMSKMFTGIAILKLLERATIDFEDSVRKHLPFLPKEFDQITVRHLVHHRSGLIDDHEIFERAAVHPAGSDNQRILEVCQKFWQSNPATHCSPDTNYEYTNLNYILLAELVTSVSSRPFREFLRTEIFGPAEMTATLLADTNYVPTSGGGYVYDGTRYNQASNATVSAGDGRVFSTLADMARCHRYIRSEGLSKLLAPPMTSTMLAHGRYSSGFRLDPNTGIFGHAGWDEHGTGVHLFLPGEVPFSLVYLSKAAGRKDSHRGSLVNESKSIGNAMVAGWRSIDVSNATVDY